MDDIKKAIQDARASRIGHIYGQFSNVADVQESETDIKKADDAEEPGETEETDEGKEKETDAESNAENMVETDEETSEEYSTEKSDIMYAFGGGDIKISKTGKQIKEQVDNVILPELNAALAVKENEATEKLKECGQAPTACVPVWWTGDVKMDVGYKFYDWQETEFCKPENQRMYATLSANDEAEFIPFCKNKKLSFEKPEEISIEDHRYFKGIRRKYIAKRALQLTSKELYQAVEGMYHNLNTLQ